MMMMIPIVMTLEIVTDVSAVHQLKAATPKISVSVSIKNYSYTVAINRMMMMMIIIPM